MRTRIEAVMVSGRRIEKTDGAAPQREGCRHYWLIAPQAGPTSRAECKRCHAVREFRNAAEDYVEDGVGRQAAG